MKHLIIIGIFLSGVGASAQDHKTDPKQCALEDLQMKEIKTQLEQFKADCGKYPANLIYLLERSSDCKNWGSKGAYIKRKPTNHKMLRSFSYALSADGYTLKSKDCY